MPLYEYQCENCGDVFEIIQKFSDTPLTVHETCGGAVHRLLSAPALMFKGSGWYVNDYAKGSGTAPNGGGKKTESGDTSSSTSESKDSAPSKDTAPAKSESGSKSKSSDSGSSSTTPSPASTH